MTQAPLTVFVSYAHADKDLKDQLALCLSGLMRQKKIDLWIDNCIDPGAAIDEVISEALIKADIVLLLISPNFIASNYCYEKELAKALEMHSRGACAVIPVIVRPCDWQPLPFGELRALPEDGKPVTTWVDRDSAWHDVTQQIRKYIDGRKTTAVGSERSRSDELRVFLKRAFQQLADRYERRGLVGEDDFSIGIEDLDFQIGGIGRETLSILAGRHRGGQQDLLLNALAANGIRGCQMAMLCPRGDGVGVSRGLISLLGRVDKDRILCGDLDEDDWPRVTNAIAISSSIKLHIDSSCEPYIQGVCDRIVRYVKEDGVTLVFVDDLERFDVASGEHRSAVRALKDVATKYSIAIICTLTLTAKNHLIGKMLPTTADLLEWNDLAHEADLLAFVHATDDGDNAPAQKCEVVVARCGGAPVSGSYSFAYNPATAVFNSFS